MNNQILDRDRKLMARLICFQGGCLNWVVTLELKKWIGTFGILKRVRTLAPKCWVCILAVCLRKMIQPFQKPLSWTLKWGHKPILSPCLGQSCDSQKTYSSQMCFVKKKQNKLPKSKQIMMSANCWAPLTPGSLLSIGHKEMRSQTGQESAVSVPVVTGKFLVLVWNQEPQIWPC